MNKVFVSLALGSFLVASANAQSADVQPTEYPTFRIGLLGEPEGCRSRVELDGQKLSAYLDVMEQRLGRSVELCGVTEQNAIDKLQSEQVDFAFVTVSDPAAPPRGIRPILSWRREAELPRLRFLSVGLGEQLAKQPDEDAIIVGYTPEEVRRGLAYRAGSFSDTADAWQMLDVYAQDYSSEFSEQSPTIFPEDAAAELREAGPVASFVMTEGRYDIFCMVHEDVCADLTTSESAYVPIHQAFAVRTDMPGTLMYRLIGMHVQMHHRFPVAFSAIAPAGVSNLEPTEPTAFGFDW